MKNIFNKALSLLLAVLMVFSLGAMAACNSDEEPDATAETEEDTGEKLSVVVFAEDFKSGDVIAS